MPVTPSRTASSRMKSPMNDPCAPELCTTITHPFFEASSSISKLMNESATVYAGPHTAMSGRIGLTDGSRIFRLNRSRSAHGTASYRVRTRCSGDIARSPASSLSSSIG